MGNSAGALKYDIGSQIECKSSYYSHWQVFEGFTKVRIFYLLLIAVN